jgi:sugar phosphate isomerase/epimerase
MNPLVLGAALPIADLESNRDWLHQHGGRDLEIQDPCVPAMLDHDWKPLLETLKNHLDGHGGRVGIHAPFDGYQIGSYDPLVGEFVAKRMLKALEFVADIAETLGKKSPHMVLHSPFLFFGHALVAHSEATDLRRQIGFVQRTLEPILKKATELHCTLVIENIRDTNPHALLETVKSFDSEFVRMSLDAGHANLMHHCGGPKADQWVRQAGALLGHVHLQDNDGMLDHHWHPGQGEINWWAVCTELGKLEQSPRLILELRNHEVQTATQWFVERGLAQ